MNVLLSHGSNTKTTRTEEEQGAKKKPPLVSIRKNPPKHYRLYIESFSSLKSNEKYESGEFEAGGYKWKLVLFPNGNKNRDVKDHISLYLEMGGTKAVEPSKIVTIEYKLFLLNRPKGSYLVLEDSNKEEKTFCFYRTIVGGLAGFDRFIPIKDFNDESNGYLIDDRCEFGAEVLVSETSSTRISKGECVLSKFNTATYKQVWKVTKFSTLDDTCHYSEPFTAENQKYCAWILVLCPKGVLKGKGSHISLSLRLHNPHELPPGSKVLAQFTVRILDQIHGNHRTVRTYKYDAVWFKPGQAWAVDRLITLEENARFSVDDSCIFEVEITIQGLSMPSISKRHNRHWPWN